jgi:hypothetical protein
MPRRSAPAGKTSETNGAAPETFAVARARADGLWDGYLDEPATSRLGISTSGGGIRSASFALGSLQVLQEKGVLHAADHLACVSGGGYMSIAHAVLLSETLKRANPGGTDDDPAAEQGNKRTIEREYFGRHAPWSAGSPEEQHLRDRLKYLASGFLGWVWLIVNLAYGMLRHLLPFASTIYLAGFITGIAMSGWLGESLRTPPNVKCTGPGCIDSSDLLPFVYLGLALIAVAAVLLSVRMWGQKRSGESLGDVMMLRLQNLALGAIGIGVLVLVLFVAVPQLMLSLHDGLLMSVGLPQAGGLVGLATVGLSVASWIAKNRRTKWFQVLATVLVWLSAPLFILVPYVGFAYWNAQLGTRWEEDPIRLILAATSLLVLVALWRFLDEVTSTAHLFYRERLATAFVGYRRMEQTRGRALLRHEQPPWKDPINFSDIDEQAKKPNLIVCAAANLSGDLPAGRLGASITFEWDWSGGPTTGYVPTQWLEAKSGQGVVTLPALMAISGAAVAPSMGKMTIPPLRFLMAVFNLRLGVWIPNPYKAPQNRTAWQLREQGRSLHDTLQPGSSTALPKPRRPGGLYVFRESVGANTLERSYVYVTDGGHWENLGLVELLRRGCGRIIVIDGSGGDAKSFGTLSEAIALARADLGVEISIDLSQMTADDAGNSRVGFAEGVIAFPDDTRGKILYVRAVRCPSAPDDVVGYAARDSKFPNHPTSDQFFDEERFEAYRALGRYLTSEALHGRAGQWT